MATSRTSIRLNKQPADETVKELGLKSRTEAGHMVVKELEALRKFKNLMAKYSGRLSFEALGE